jgi:hypothetical protein
MGLTVPNPYPKEFRDDVVNVARNRAGPASERKSGPTSGSASRA